MSAERVISMNNSNGDKVKTMTVSALLCALGILIPMTFPSLKPEPASFTLASHVPLIIAMFISPTVTAFVAVVTTLGFLINFPLVVALRALSHLIFSLIGAFILKKNNNLLLSYKNTAIFAFTLSLIHGICEVAVVSYFYWVVGMTDIFYEKGYLYTVVLLVGLGTVIHSLVDFSIAIFVWKPLQYIISIPANAKIKIK
jgi:niacin transporter